MASGENSALSRMIDAIERGAIALLLGLMTLVTFANVVARYVFNANILWALETTVFLFAWLVLLGASHLVKSNAHLGVDALVAILAPGPRKALTLLAGLCCIAYAALMLKGGLDYYAPFIGQRAWYETQDIPMLSWLRWIEPLLNEGEAYEKLPRFIPYVILPVALALLLIRFAQAVWKVWVGHGGLMVASHEAEELLDDAVKARED